MFACSEDAENTIGSPEKVVRSLSFGMTLSSLTRREFVSIIATQSALALIGCDSSPTAPEPDAATLASRPRSPTETGGVGFQSLGLGTSRDGFVYAPPTYSPSSAAPLVVLLHGTGSSSAAWRTLLPDLVDATGVVVLCPDSRSGTWDLSLGGFGPDVRFIDDALALVFRRYRIDSTKIAFGGFSNGASYALSLGVNNGDLFSALIAFSPGFFTPPGRRGKPRVFASHGDADPLLMNTTTPRIVPTLRDEGYDVTYRLFSGVHELPLAVAAEALTWFLM
jgi:phospholipase/carboxylesterase